MPSSRLTLARLEQLLLEALEDANADALCQAGELQVGRRFVTETGQASAPRWVVNFPTKQHWRQPSQLRWVADGLMDLRRFIAQHRVRSIAIPALGAGLGGLAWPDVRVAIESALAELDDVQINVYEPLSTPEDVR